MLKSSLNWAFNLSLKNSFKVINVPFLGSLSHSQPMLEPLDPIVLYRIFRCVHQSRVNQKAGDGSPRPSFACIAVNHNHIVFVLIQELIHIFTGLEQDFDAGRVMVDPIKICNFAFSKYFLIVSSARHVVDLELAIVLFIQVADDLDW